MKNNVYAYSEIFDSIQGEGEYTGYPTAWLRFYLCNFLFVVINQYWNAIGS